MFLFRPMLRPPRFDGSPQDAASLRSADVAPASGAQGDSGPLDGWSRKFPARDVDELKRQIQEDFGGKAGLAHDDAQPGAASGAEGARQFSIECLRRASAVGRLAHTSACISNTVVRRNCHTSGRRFYMCASVIPSIRRVGVATLVLLLTLPAIALAQSPWERAANNLATTFTGPLARSLALVAIVIGGLMFMYGEGGAKRQISGIVFGGGLALFAGQFLTWLF